MQYRQHRYPTFYPVNVRAPRGAQRGEVIDVNHSGARLKGLTGVNRGDKIRLDILSRHVDAVVLWATGELVGVMFRPKLSDHQMDTLRQRCTRRITPERSSVGFRFAEMS
jgi:hypothetical protein